MLEAYKIFISLLKADYHVFEVNSLSDYMDWLKSHGFTIGTYDCYSDGFSFTFDCNSTQAVFQGVMTLIRTFSETGYTSNTEQRYEFNTKCEDIVIETEYQNCSDMACEWIDDEQKELGVYRAYKYKFKYEDALIIPCDFESYYFQTHNDFSKLEDKINKMPSWGEFKSYRVVDGCATFEWFEVEN